jgi:hypothetical protein
MKLLGALAALLICPNRLCPRQPSTSQWWAT